MSAERLCVQAFSESAEPALRLAKALAVPFREIALHQFPDGESLVRIAPAGETVVIYRSLDDPNSKLIELLLATEALRGAGAKRLVLVAPYLCYMRQDKAFHDGEAISQRIVGHFLSNHVDAIVTVDPHLHRTKDLSAVFPTARALATSATALLAERLKARQLPSATLLVGPDGESRQWVEAVAAPLGLGVLVGEKQRHGDRTVSIEFAELDHVMGRRVVLVDDVVSTGATLIESTRQLVAAGATRVEVLATHMLAAPGDLAALRAAGVETIESTDSVPHETNSVHLAPLLAAAVKELMS